MGQIQQDAYTYLKTALGWSGDTSLVQLEYDFLASEGYTTGGLDSRWKAYLDANAPPSELSQYLIGRRLGGILGIPIITSASSGSVAENSVLAHTLTASESVTWSIAGGADQARYEISGSTLRWLSNGTKDFEAPDDSGANNTYIVTVRATDTSGNTADQTITYTVTDVSEAWSPLALGADLGAWQKGDSLTGADTDPITTWTDSSGNGKNYTQSGAARPLVAAANLNGMNVARFDSTNLYFDVPNVFGAAAAGSIYMVLKNNNDPSVSETLSGMARFGNSTGGSTVWHHPWTDGAIYCEFGTTSRKSYGNPTPSLASWRIQSVHSASADHGMYIDGVLFASTGTNTVGWDSSPKFGRSTRDPDTTPSYRYFYGWAAEVILVKAKLSQANREKMEGYLAHKWGLTGNLSAGHPYKSTPP